MTEQQKIITAITSRLMEGLIARGTVKPGSAPDDWNTWCIRKAQCIYKDILDTVK